MPNGLTKNEFQDWLDNTAVDDCSSVDEIVHTDLNDTETPELGVVGGAAFITGFVFTISAWGKIDKAGDALTGKPYK